MEEKKPSTADILAKIRAQKSAATAAAAAPAEVVPPAPETTPAAEPVSAVEALAATTETPKPTPAAGPKPTSTKDIMAAIRAGGAKPTPSASPAAKAPSAAGPASPAPAATAPATTAPATTAPKAAAAPGPKLTPQEMLQKMREAKAAGVVAATAPATPAKSVAPVAPPPMPAKPVAAGKPAKPSAVKRGMAGFTVVATLFAVFLVLGYLTGSTLLIAAAVLVWGLLLTPFAAAWAAVAGVGGIWTLGTARFMFPNVLVEPPSKFKVGPASDYPLNTVSNKWKDQFGIWIVHTDQLEGRNLIFALASVCTHLGCTPNWLDGEQKFKCPCHGSGFYMTGINFEGPAPRPLERMGLRIAEDGMLEVNKSVKYQEEMGQWADSTSYVEVV